MKESSDKSSDTSHVVSGNADTDGVMAALKRAVKRAHLIAYQTGTSVVIVRDGKVVDIEPDPELYEDLLPEKLRTSR